MVESDDTGILPCIVGVAASSYITLCNSVTIPCFKNVNDVFLSHPTLKNPFFLSDHDISLHSYSCYNTIELLYLTIDTRRFGYSTENAGFHIPQATKHSVRYCSEIKESFEF